MISKQQLEEWEKQNEKDKQQFKKDEEYLKSLETVEDKKIRSFFERVPEPWCRWDPSTSTSGLKSMKSLIGFYNIRILIYSKWIWLLNPKLSSVVE